MARKIPTSYEEAALFKEEVVLRWKPQADVWPFLHGDDILGTITALGGIYMTHAFRKALKIRPYAKITCYSPAVGLPALGCYLFHAHVITSDVLQVSSCPLCITTKATIGQVVYGIGLPMLLATTVCFHVADRLLTYPVPPVMKAPGEVFRLFKKIMLKNPRPLMVMGAIHVLAASFISYQKHKTLFKIGFVYKKKN